MELERVTIDMPVSLRDRLRLCCATNNITMRAFINEAIEENLSRQEKTNPFSFVKKEVDILAVCKEYTSFSEETKSYAKGTCPFEECKESKSNSSFVVSRSEQIFYCFGCNAGGDVVAFIAKYKNLASAEALFELMNYVRKRDGLEPYKEMSEVL